MQRIENICSSFSYFLLSFLSTRLLHLPFFFFILSSRQIYTIRDPYHLKRTLVEQAMSGKRIKDSSISASSKEYRYGIYAV